MPRSYRPIIVPVILVIIGIIVGTIGIRSMGVNTSSAKQAFFSYYMSLGGACLIALGAILIPRKQ